MEPPAGTLPGSAQTVPGGPSPWTHGRPQPGRLALGPGMRCAHRLAAPPGLPVEALRLLGGAGRWGRSACCSPTLCSLQRGVQGSRGALTSLVLAGDAALVGADPPGQDRERRQGSEQQGFLQGQRGVSPLPHPVRSQDTAPTAPPAWLCPRCIPGVWRRAGPPVPVPRECCRNASQLGCVWWLVSAWWTPTCYPRERIVTPAHVWDGPQPRQLLLIPEGPHGHTVWGHGPHLS